MTDQWLEVAREIAKSAAHPDTEAIFRTMRTRLPTISLDTVYRTLTALEGLRLIGRVDATAGPTRHDANLLHDHFVCYRCGLIREVNYPSLNGLEAPDLADELDKVQSVRVELRGLCKTCQESDCQAGTEGDRR